MENLYGESGWQVRMKCQDEVSGWRFGMEIRDGELGDGEFR